MIKRVVLFFVVAFLSMQFTFSQPFSARLGIKAGVVSGNYKFTRSVYEDYRVSTSGRTGFHVGMFARLKILMLHVQPELTYSHERYSLRTLFDGDETSSTVRLNSIDLPLLFGINVMWFRFQFGPVFNLSTDTSLRHKDGSKHWIHLNKPTVSYMLGLGADLSRFTFDVRYQGQLKRPKQFTAVGDDDGFAGKMKFRSWMFSLGYMF